MTAPASRILIVDDEKNMRNYLSIILEKDGYEVATASTGAEALEQIRSRPFVLVIQDIRMKEMDGIELLKHIKDYDRQLPVVIMTAYATWETAVEAMRLGAYDFIKKPFENQAIRNIAKRLIEYQANRAQADASKDTEDIFHLAQIVGNSAAMDQVFHQIQTAAQTEATVLITGESGVGKELAARALHYGSFRRNESFIAINCGALVGTLLENEIFGHAKGAYTGADNTKQGLLEIANRGTFFMDEIGDLNISLQSKILKALEDREYYPVGATKKVFVDVRFIAATNQNLEELIANERFRKDLFYRINVIPINIPPLRERREDIPLLAGYFLKKHSANYKRDIRRFSEEALNIIISYTWPGNVRELENCIQRAILTAQTDMIEKNDLTALTLGAISEPAAPAPAELFPGFSLEAEIQAMEKSYIDKALAANDGNMTKAAESLGMTFRALRYKVKKYNIDTKKG